MDNSAWQLHSAPIPARVEQARSTPALDVLDALSIRTGGSARCNDLAADKRSQIIGREAFPEHVLSELIMIGPADFGAIRVRLSCLQVPLCDLCQGLILPLEAI